MLTPQMIRHLEAKFDATRGWFGWSDWDMLSSQLRGALNSEAQWQNCQIASGAITPYREGRLTHVYVDTELSLAFDQLEQVTVPFNAANGDLLILRQIDNGRRIEIVHDLTKLDTLGRADFTLDKLAGGYDLSIFMLMDGIWLEVMRHPLPSTTDRISAGLSYEPAVTVISGSTINAEAALVHVTGPLSGGTASMGTIDVTSVSAGDTGPIEVWIQQPAGGGEYFIGAYVQQGSDTEADVEQGLEAAINALTSTTGWSALYNGVSMLLEVYAPVELGADADLLTLAISNGTLSSITVAGMAGGVDGTQQDADIEYVTGLATNGTCVIVNRNDTALIRFVQTGTIKVQGGTVLQPGQMATVLDQDGSTLVVVHSPSVEIVTLNALTLLNIGTTPVVITSVNVDEGLEFELLIKSYFNTTPFTLAATIQLVSTTSVVVGEIPASVLTGSTNAVFRFTAMLTAMPVGDALYLTTAGSVDPAGGDGHWEIEIRKTLHKF